MNDALEVKIGVSVIAVCMNRNENLKNAVHSWLTCRGVDEIVLIDWSSTIPVAETLEELWTGCGNARSKLRFVRVLNQDMWILTVAYNLAARLAQGHSLLKLDCDYVLQPNFIEVHELTDGRFYSGFWERARNLNEQHLNGLVFLKVEDFFRVNGYNEHLQLYGWDDSDLYERLEKTGLQRLPIKFDTVRHLPHEDHDRGIVRKPRNRSVVPHLLPQSAFGSIQYNRILSQHAIWDGSSKMNQFKMQQIYQTSSRGVLPIWEATSTQITADVPPETLIQVEQKWIQFMQTHPRGFVESLAASTNVEGRMTQHICTTSCFSNVLELHALNGLGNRLRAFASAVHLVHQLNSDKRYNSFPWKLNLVWKKDHHCQANLNDLLEVVDNYITSILIESHTTDCPERKVVSIGHSDQHFSTSVLVVDDVIQLLRFLERDSSRVTPIRAIVHTSSVIPSPFQNWVAEASVIQSLKPKATIQSLIQQILTDTEKAGVKLSEMIGVHVRKGQKTISADDIQNWSADKKLQWTQWREASGYSRFAAQMRKEIETDRNVCFFLATDSQEGYDFFVSEFGKNRIYFLKRELFDRSEVQLTTAVADAIALSKTRKFLASNWSSFSELVRRFKSVHTLVAGIDF